MALPDLLANLKLNIQNYTQGLQQAASLTKSTAAQFGKSFQQSTVDAQTAGKAIDDFGKKASTTLGGLATKTAQFTTSFFAVQAFASGLTGTIGEAMDFDRALRDVQSITKDTDQHIKDIGNDLLKMVVSGDSAGRSAAELALAMRELVSVGFSAEDSVNLVRIAAEGASAGLSTTEVASTALLNSLLAYNMPVSEAQRVMDTLFTTVNLGAIKFETLATNLGLVIPSAAALNIPFEDLGATIAFLSQTSPDTSRIFSNLNQVLTKMIKPTKEGLAAAAALGIEYDATAVKSKGFVNVLKDIVDKAGDNEEALGKMFGDVRSLRGILPIVQEEGTPFLKLLEDFNAEMELGGATIRALTEQKKSLAFQVEQLGAKMQAFFTFAWMNAMQPALVGLAKGLNEVLTAFGNLVQYIAEHEHVLRALEAVAIGLGVAFAVHMHEGIYAAGKALLGFLAIAPKAILAAVGFLGPWGLAITAIVGILYYTGILGKAWDFLSEKGPAAFNAIKDAVVGLFNAITNSKIFKELAADFLEGLRVIREVAMAIYDFLMPLFEAVFKFLAPVLKPVLAFISAIAALVVSLGMAKVIVAFIVGILGILFSPIIINIAVIVALITIIGALSRHWDELRKVATDAWNAIKGAVTSAVNAISDAFNSIISAVGNFFKSLWDGIVGAVNSVVDEVTASWNHFIEVVKNAPGAVVQFVKDQFNALAQFFRNIWDSISDDTKQKIATFVVIITLPLILLVAAILQLWNGLAAQTRATFELLKSIAEFVWTAIRVTIETVMNAVKTVVTAVWDYLSNWLTDRWNNLKNNATLIWNAVSALFNTVFNAIKSVVVPAWQAVEQFLTTSWNTLSETATTIFTAISTFISGIWETISSAASEAWGFIAQTVTDAWNGIKTTITNITSEIWNGVSSWVTDIVNVVGGMASSLVAFGSDLYNAGASLLTEFFNGTASVIGAVIEGVGDLAGQIVTAIRRYALAPALRAIDSAIPNSIDMIIGSIDIPDNPIADITGYSGWAKGVRDFAGGLSLLGEHGPEFAFLPRGTSVLPAGRTSRIMDQMSRINNGTGGSTYQFDFHVDKMVATDDVQAEKAAKKVSTQVALKLRGILTD